MEEKKLAITLLERPLTETALAAAYPGGQKGLTLLDRGAQGGPNGRSETASRFLGAIRLLFTARLGVMDEFDRDDTHGNTDEDSQPQIGCERHHH